MLFDYSCVTKQFGVCQFQNIVDIFAKKVNKITRIKLIPRFQVPKCMFTVSMWNGIQTIDFTFER